jgi:histidine ammonia-lyase
MSEAKQGVSERTRTALNILAVHTIAAAQAANASPQEIDAARLEKVLAAIEARVLEARQEIDRW